MLAFSLLLLGAPRARAQTPAVLIVSQAGAELTIIDGSTDSVRTHIGLAPGPAGVAVTPDGALAYVSHPESRRISVVDLREGRVVATWNVGTQPFAVAVGADGAVWVSDWSLGAVHRLEPTRGVIEDTIEVGRAPVALHAASATQRLYTVNRDSDDVSVVDTRQRRVITRIAVGRAPYAIAASPNQQRLYVVNVQGGTLSEIDAVTNRVSRTIPVGRMPYGVAWGARGQLLVTLQQSNKVALVDLAHHRTRTIAVGESPEGVVVASSSRAYVSNWFSDEISVLDLAHGKERRRIPCAAGPRALAIVAPGEADSR